MHVQAAEFDWGLAFWRTEPATGAGAHRRGFLRITYIDGSPATLLNCSSATSSFTSLLPCRSKSCSVPSESKSSSLFAGSFPRAGRSALDMAPTRTMTGDTALNDIEKGPQSPTDTERTLGGDAIIEIGDDDGASTIRSSSDSGSRSSGSDAPAQPPRTYHTSLGLDPSTSVFQQHERGIS
jgi:hypothetical protein